jgi:ribosomal protein S12 methylthiotransferase
MMGVFPYSPEPGTPMGRMEGQLPDSVKQARVEELMLTQQKVAFKKMAALKGQTVPVLIDRPAGRDLEDGYVARATSQAPDIDSITLVHTDTELHPGQLLDVRITGSEGYDLLAELPRKKARGLPVLK